MRRDDAAAYEILMKRGIEALDTGPYRAEWEEAGRETRENLIGRIFSTSSKSSSMAIGTANANRALRLLVHTMREDLSRIDMANGFLVIRKVRLTNKDDDEKGRFYLTADERDQYAGLASPDNLPPTPLQSDMLIFFTNRRTNSFTELEVLPIGASNPNVQEPGEVWQQTSSSQLSECLYLHQLLLFSSDGRIRRGDHIQALGVVVRELDLSGYFLPNIQHCEVLLLIHVDAVQEEQLLVLLRQRAVYSLIDRREHLHSLLNSGHSHSSLCVLAGNVTCHDFRDRRQTFTGLDHHAE